MGDDTRGLGMMPWSQYALHLRVAESQHETLAYHGRDQTLSRKCYREWIEALAQKCQHHLDKLREEEDNAGKQT